ncbi:hypothetical protein OIU85_027645 [Salix viminalis]|uniref:Uncharacterized protein n=1 Tax=Salix viminalis TaxID=40686 RepID=A0A9Q0QIS8_SALVM|nr:hypothetical protein OIU85_027645 [Salix viminalis]
MRRLGSGFRSSENSCMMQRTHWMNVRRQVVKNTGSTGRKLRRFFSSSNKLALRRKIKDLTYKLAGIESMKSKFDLDRASKVEDSPVSAVTTKRRLFRGRWGFSDFSSRSLEAAVEAIP